MTRELQVTFDAADPISQSHFWAEALGYAIPPPPGHDLRPGEDPLAAWADFFDAAGVPQDQRDTASAIVPSEGGSGPRIFFQKVPETKGAKNRVHLDVRSAPGLAGAERMAALELECDRLVALGATRLQRHEPAPPMSSGFIVLADPEGNEFCLD